MAAEVVKYMDKDISSDMEITEDTVFRGCTFGTNTIAVRNMAKVEILDCKIGEIHINGGREIRKGGEK